MKVRKLIGQKFSSLSVVMPVYNEEGAIEKVVRNFCDAVLNKFEKKEFVLVNDCSTDSTLSILERLKHEYPYIRVITNTSNQGHGPSLVRAYNEAKENYIFHCDSDNQFRAEDFWLLWEQLTNNDLELVMGYRKQRKDPMYRIVMSLALKVFNFVLFGLWCQDINAPFKLYTRPALKRILAIVPKNAFVPTILMVLLAKAYGMHIEEVAVRHLPRLTGKSFVRNWKIIVFCYKGMKEISEFKSLLGNVRPKV